VQDQAEIATIVSTQSGSVVADQLQQWSSGPSGGVGLELGSPTPSTTWQFAQNTNSAGAVVAFTLANPGQDSTTATVEADLSSGSVVPVRMVLPAQSVTDFVASSAPRLPAQVPYALTVRASSPIVVGRSVRQSAAGATPPVWGSSMGVMAPALRWWVPGPGVAGAPGTAGATITTLAVANSGQEAAQVVVSTPGRSRPVASLTVKPHSLRLLGAPQVGDLNIYEVQSTQPVTVEEDDGPTGATGIVSSVGLPFWT
jgi:hypothetical protein